MSLLWVHSTGRIRGQIVCDGDSITEAPSESLGERYPTIAAGLVNGGRCAYSNVGVSGQSMESRRLAFGTDVEPLYNAKRHFNIASIAAGTNDLGTGTDAATLITRAQGWVTLAVAAGFKPAVMTLLPRNMGGGTTQTIFDGWRATYNTWVTDTLTGAIVWDAGAIPELQDYTDADYYKDGTHPTPAGLALMGALLADEVNAWLESGSP